MNLQRLIISLAGMFVFLNVSAQTKISLKGRITDAGTGEPLAGATIYLADDKIGSTADSNGKYIFKNIPPGHHVIEVSFTGYGTLTVHFEIAADTEKDFALTTAVIENEGVTVTGVAGATTIRKSPVAIASLRKTALLQQASMNIIEALTHLPGVSQLSSGPAISKPIIRGLGYNRIVTVNEGLRQEGQQWGDEHGIEIDEMSVGRVEVLKGPASLMYGSDALAGVINFITSNPVAEGDFKGNILSNFQSNNDLFAFHGNLAANKRGLNWNLSGTYKSAGNYRNRFDGRVLNSGFNEKNFGGYLGLNKSWGYSHFIFSRFDQQIGMVEGERDDATGKFLLFAGSSLERVATNDDLSTRHLFVPMQRVVHHKLILDNNFSIKKSRLKITLGYQKNQRKEFGNPENTEEKSLYFDLTTFNYNLQWQFPEVKEWHTTVGINGMKQGNENKGEEVLIPEYDLFDFGSFAYVQRLFKKTTLSGGIRFDNRSVDSKEYFEGANQKFVAFTRSFFNFSGSVGISVEPSPAMTIKANIARGFRAPTLAEMASKGAHEGTNRYEYGDQNLKSETSLQIDAGFNLDNEHISFGISPFYNSITDFIFYRKMRAVAGGDSLVNVSGEFIQAYQFTQQDARLAGLEVQIDIHPHPVHWLHFENTISLVRGRFDKEIDGSKNLPLIPAVKWITELRGDFKKAGPYLSNLYFKIELDNTFKQNNPFTGFETETATHGYSLLNAAVGADLTNAKKQIILGLHIALSNITDVAYQSHLSRLKYTDENRVTGRKGVFNTGRNFSVKLNVPLNFKVK